VAAGKLLGPARRKQSSSLAESFPLTVIVPAFNAAGTLQAVLDALLVNDMDHVEVLVVDDASTDETPAVARTYGRVELVRLERRGGPAAARNRGTAEARHPWLLFLDADVLLPRNAVESMRDSLDLYSHRSDVAGVLGCYAEEIPHRDFPTNFKNLSTAYLYHITDTLSPFLHTPIFLVRREVLEDAGGFDANLRRAEDFRLGLALGSRGYRFVIDRRVRGVHLKRYTVAGILREDWGRIRSLSQIELTPEERRFSWRAHRFGRLLSLALPGPTLFLLVLGLLWDSRAAWMAPAMLALFGAANLGFFRFVRRRRGWLEAFGSLGMLWLEMLWAEMALAASVLGGSRRKVSAPRS
jgi:glycosyltransferase involved in cell wall biosynthesis